jgi:hypothetical protein
MSVLGPRAPSTLRSDEHVHSGDLLRARLKDWLVVNDELALSRSAVTRKQPAGLHRGRQSCRGPHAGSRFLPSTRSFTKTDFRRVPEISPLPAEDLGQDLGWLARGGRPVRSRRSHASLATLAMAV